MDGLTKFIVVVHTAEAEEAFGYWAEDVTHAYEQWADDPMIVGHLKEVTKLEISTAESK